MTLDEIYDQWAQDVEMDPSELASEALKIPKLHHRYYRIFSDERLRLIQQQEELKVLLLDKHTFFTEGHNEDTRKLGWQLPARGTVLKSAAEPYVSADQDVIKARLSIAYQKEKVELLDSIIKSLRERGFQIKSAIDFIKFTSGA